MGFDNYKIVLYRQDDGSWVAEIPSLPGCYALMATREEALVELGAVFQMIAEEYREKGLLARRHHGNRACLALRLAICKTLRASWAFPVPANQAVSEAMESPRMAAQ